MNDFTDSPDRTSLDRVLAHGTQLQPGMRVRLHPMGRADIFDLALEGKTAIVESIERDLEDRVHVAVVVEDDPGRDLGLIRQPGHRFFFGIEEVEPLGSGAS